MRAVTAIAGTRARERLVTAGLVLATSVIAARSIVGLDSRLPKALVALLILAGAAILLAIDTGQLLLGWLFLAPLFQESASRTHIGHVLALALYTAPPLAVLVKMLAARGERPRRRWFDFFPAFYLLFVVGSLLLTASGELRSGAVGTLRDLYQTTAIGVLVYYVAAFWRGRGLSIEKISQLLLAAAGLQALMTVVEWGTGWNLWHDTSWKQAGDVRAIGTLGNPALTGAFIGVGIVLALSVLCWRGPRSLHLLSVLVLVVGVPGLYATKTRGPIVATLVACVLVALLSSRARVASIAAIACVGLVLLMFWPQIQSSSVYRSRIDETQNVDARLVLQRVSLKLAEQRPILGWGYNSFDRVKFRVPVATAALTPAVALQSTSHDTFLTMLVEYGVVGLALFLIPWVAVYVRALRRARVPSADRWFAVAAMAGILVIAIDGATLDYRFFSFVPMLAWLLLGLLRRQVAGADLVTGK